MYDFRQYRRLVIVIVILRLLIGPLIFADFWAATIVSFFLDWIDGEFFKRAGYPRPYYSLWDKILDYWWYVWVMAFLFTVHVPNLYIFLLLFILRSAGQFIYFATRSEFFLFLFPNFFEVLFYCYLLIVPFPHFVNYLNSPDIYRLLAVIVPTVFVREYIIHIRVMNLSWLFFGHTTLWQPPKNSADLHLLTLFTPNKFDIINTHPVQKAN